MRVPPVAHVAQSFVRVLKAEVTSVKVLYLGMFSVLGTSIAMLATGDAIWMSWSQTSLVVLCGAIRSSRQPPVALLATAPPGVARTSRPPCTPLERVCSLLATTAAHFRAGLWGFGVQVLLTWGLAHAGAARAMTMSYTSILWGEIAGIALFHEWPNLLAVLGILIVVSGTLYTSVRGQPARSQAGSGALRQMSATVRGPPQGSASQLPEPALRRTSGPL